MPRSRITKCLPLFRIVEPIRIVKHSKQPFEILNGKWRLGTKNGALLLLIK
jgi:hypothetical protein